MSTLRMAGDDERRGKHGLVVSMKSAKDGTLRLVIDRVSLRPNGDWRPLTPVTYKDFPEEDIRGMTVAHADVETLGMIVLSEMSASVEVEDD